RKSGRVLTSGCERLSSSDVVAWGRWRPNEKCPPTRAGDNAHKSETRISAIADFARKGKRKKKALPLSPRARRHGRAIRQAARLVVAGPRAAYHAMRRPPRAHHRARIPEADRLGGAEERPALARAPFEPAAAYRACDRPA